MISASDRPDDRPTDLATGDFDLTGPLPTGRTVLEASAGTGKTYTIAGLVARYVAEGACELQELLVVTFTRAATAELRDRVRTRLVDTSNHLERVLAGGDPQPPDADQVAALLAGADASELRRRRARLEAALADFDAATISTIHGFCQHVLHSLGMAGDVDRDATFVEDQAEIIDAVCDDLLVERFHDSDDQPVSRRDLRNIATKLVANPDADVVPRADEAEGPAAVRAELATRLREALGRRKRQARVLSFDDLLTRLADSLNDPVHGDAACANLRGRYRVALIDEFQDTDPVQWDILSTAFGDEGSTLVLIGDPKQAIYSFRGADVYAYLEAARTIGEPATLRTNWRSDADLLAAYDRLFRGATFGHPDIRYRSVDAAPGRDDPRLTDAPVGAPVRVRIVRRDLGLRGWSGNVNAGAARKHIAADASAEIVRLLESDASLIKRDRQGQAVDHDRLAPGDIAVLARTNAEAAQMQRALAEVGVPAIINGVGSVFATPAATAWRHLLAALERPSSAGRARAAALTPFLDWSAGEIADADDTDLTPVHERLHAWAAILRDRGVASLLRTISLAEELPGRLLCRQDGERLLTDLEHLGELLHAAAAAEDLGATSLLGWLDERIAETDEDAVAPDERARRLESDAEAVQILTIHRAKGLEYPVVAAPFLWSAGRTWDEVPVFHERGDGTRRAVDAGGKDNWDGFEDHHERAMHEKYGEDLRLLYVALTRARHQALVWFAPTKNGEHSPLAKVLFGHRDDDGSVDTTGPAALVSDERLQAKLDALAGPAQGRIAIEHVPREPSSRPWSGRPDRTADLETATFERSLDRAWHRTSYSRLTARTHDAPRVGSETDEQTKDDERLAEGVSAIQAQRRAVTPTLDEAALRAIELPLAVMPGGTEIGTFIHSVLEHTDFAADPLVAELDRALQEQSARRRIDLGDRAVVLEGLRRALTVPLGDATGDRPLTAFGEQQRLNELDFEFPVDVTGVGGLTVADIADLLDRHLAPTDPLADYARRLRDPMFDVDVRGYLAGQIDLVLRVSEDGGDRSGDPSGYRTGDRFVVVDHKTNWLAPFGEEATAWHYRPDVLADAMMRGHYPLQALIYTVAVHRYLRWRLRTADGAPAYDPARHLGGVAYLFLRGMVGAEHGGQPCGVFSWQPPAELIVELSDLLDRGRAAA